MSKSNLDLSIYVAIGDSITAGYADGALYYKGQLTSYPSLLAAQFRPGTSFKQALLNPDSVGVGFNGNSRLIARASDNGTLNLCFIAPQGDLSAFATNSYSNYGPFNNMSVPGLKAVTALLDGYGNAHNGEGNYNPFFTRMASDPQRASILSDAQVLRPTFFSLFIGNNDVLAHALAGCTTDAITPPALFENCIRSMINQLSSNGAKGVISGIPDISTIPYFATLPFNGLLLDASTAAEMNTRYASPGFHFEKGNNAFVIHSSTKDASEIRQIRQGEWLLLDLLMDPDKQLYLSGKVPVPKKYILTATEIAEIKRALSEYNHILKSVATDYHLAFVDSKSLVKKPKPDRLYDRKSRSLHYRSNRVFSLDGIHLTALGQALLANEFIQAINKTYYTSIPKITLSKYRKEPYLD